MNNNEMLHKFANNKKLLYITPSLIYINTLLSRYILNREIIFFENIILLFIFFFLTTTIFQLVLKKILKNDQYVFIMTTVISLLYFCEFNLKLILMFLLAGISVIIILNKMSKSLTDTCISIGIFILIIYFCMNAPQNIYSVIKESIKTKIYDETYEISIEEETLKPNIYWIHTDAMMSFDTMQKYFYYNNIELKRYLKEEQFYINESASIVVGNKTQNALAALFNPNYYDNFLKDYLSDLEEVNLGNKKETSYNISTKELADKRLESELFSAFKEKGYTTVAISKLNNYSSLNTDVLYDFYNYSTGHWHFTVTSELRKLTEKSVDNISTTHRMNQLKEGLTFSIVSPYTNTLIPYDYELLDYNSLDTSDYKTIDKTNYWQIKAILKGIEDSQTIESNKLVFIDYDLNHTGLSFDGLGNQLEPHNYMNLNSYLGNYIYAYRLLIEMIDYIKANDSEAIIIVQADHGLHTFEDDYLKEYFDTDIKGVREIRNSVMNAVYIPKQYTNGEEEYLSNPLNISRYLINNYVGENYQYLEY